MTKHEFSNGTITTHHGHCLDVLEGMADASVALVLADPPYSSGGMTRGDRAGQGVARKYQTSGTEKKYSAFSGDNRDQRSFIMWASIWLEAVQRVMEPGAIIACFADWRQMPAMSDALQVGGFVWRGTMPWIKPGARPTQGRPADSAEYIVWGTNGPRPLEGPCFPGAFTVPVERDKEHMTEKPAALMLELCKMAYKPGSVIFDPFMGSGSTLRAAQMLGKRAVGVELNPAIYQTAVQKLGRPVQPAELPVTKQEVRAA